MSESAILEAFDDLAQRQFIVYGETQAVLYADGGFPFQFRICPALARKPQLQDAPDDNKPARTFGPGSDLEFADDKLLLGTINETHHLVLNKFCVFRPQYVLLTADSFRRQDEPLSLADFDAVLAAWNRLSGSHYALYNCMEAAGSSRVHKHLQLFTHPADFTLFPDRPDAHAAKIPFREKQVAEMHDDEPSRLEAALMNASVPMRPMSRGAGNVSRHVTAGDHDMREFDLDFSLCHDSYPFSDSRSLQDLMTSIQLESLLTTAANFDTCTNIQCFEITEDRQGQEAKPGDI
ncbi:hypothetical protein UCDDS831_g08726 [Diplodia seriata]|uniref:Ap4A phosphorylase 1/2 N-terminal domain-containing protein n=1 Tax=Diplodia seriata TaxID=420778 RepID=A0A0G2G9F2_9PEZI|nr:hypothetical protein UCDDS831_g08726 [Diplodia seriata]